MTDIHMTISLKPPCVKCYKKVRDKIKMHYSKFIINTEWGKNGTHEHIHAVIPGKLDSVRDFWERNLKKITDQPVNRHSLRTSHANNLPTLVGYYWMEGKHEDISELMSHVEESGYDCESYYKKYLLSQKENPFVKKKNTVIVYKVEFLYWLIQYLEQLPLEKFDEFKHYIYQHFNKGTYKCLNVDIVSNMNKYWITANSYRGIDVEKERLW